MAFIDYYKTLEVSKNASADDIKKLTGNLPENTIRI